MQSSHMQFFKWKVVLSWKLPLTNQSLPFYTIFAFLNQARAWFLKIDPVRIVSMRACVCVCVSTPEAINN